MNKGKNSPFKLGVISDEVSQEYQRVLTFAQEQRLDGIELRSTEGKAFKDLSAAEIDDLGKRTRAAGLSIPSVASPVFKCALDDAKTRADHLDLFKRSLDYARRLEAGIVRVFAFLRQEEPTPLDTLRRAADHFRPLVEAAQGSGVRIGLENEGTTLVCTGSETRDFLAALAAPEVGVVWDPCNTLFIPGKSQPTVDDFEEIASRVIHVHVKDAVRENGAAATHCVEVGTGSLNYVAQFQGLQKAGFAGWVTLETHWRQKALTAEEQHLPAGFVFSANAEEPTRICLKNLRRLIGEALA